MEDVFGVDFGLDFRFELGDHFFESKDLGGVVFLVPARLLLGNFFKLTRKARGLAAFFGVGVETVD